MIKVTKMMITLDSLIDTRRPIYEELGLIDNKDKYIYRVLEDVEVQKRMLTRDRNMLFVDGIGETNINRLIAIISSSIKTYAITENKEPNIHCYVNTFPYIISLEEQKKLQLAYTMKYKTFHTVEVVCEEPTITSMESYDVIIDYNGLTNIETAIKDLEGSPYSDIKNSLARLNEVTMYIPALMYDEHYLTELLKQNDDIELFFINMMKEYTPIIRLEVVDLNFFNNTTGIVEEVKQEKG